MALPRIRALKGKEKKHRISERFGKTTIKRPDGDIIWIHAASNGEALSALPLIGYFQSIDNPPHILMTTMTVTGADLITKRVAPENFTHQFIPYDHPSWVSTFHDYWKPVMALWIESELWPNHLSELKRRNIPSVLLNARLSDRSVKRWAKAKKWFQNMMSCFDIVLAQTERDQNNLQSLGIQNVSVKGNLKDLSPALPFDPHAADDIRAVIETRPCILFASTHSPEETIARDIHIALKKDIPNLLSIIVPRHPKRGEDIGNMMNKDDLTIARRSLKMSPRMDTDIYIADTLGEMGLFYHLCHVVFVGNSMGTKPGGGHNLLEPAWHQCAITSGDDVHNFSTQVKDLTDKNACIIVSDINELKDNLKSMLNNTELQISLSQNAYEYATIIQAQGLSTIIDAIEPTCQKAGML